MVPVCFKLKWLVTIRIAVCVHALIISRLKLQRQEIHLTFFFVKALATERTSSLHQQNNPIQLFEWPDFARAALVLTSEILTYLLLQVTATRKYLERDCQVNAAQ